MPGISQNDAFKKSRFEQDDDDSQLVDLPALYDHVELTSVDPLQQSFHSNDSKPTSHTFSPSVYSFNAQWFTIEDIEANSEEEAIQSIQSLLENDYFDFSDLRDVIINNTVNNDEPFKVSNTKSHYIECYSPTDDNKITIKYGDSLHNNVTETFDIVNENDIPTTPESALALLVANSDNAHLLNKMLEDSNGIFVKDAESQISGNPSFELSQLPQEAVAKIFDNPENYFPKCFGTGTSSNPYSIPNHDRASIDFNVSGNQSSDFIGGFEMYFDVYDFDDVEWEPSQGSEQQEFTAGYRLAQLSQLNISDLFKSKDDSQSLLWKSELGDKIVLSDNYDGLFGTYLKSIFGKLSGKKIFDSLLDDSTDVVNSATLMAFNDFINIKKDDVLDVINTSNNKKLELK
jgi:hypothetical protein